MKKIDQNINNNNYKQLNMIIHNPKIKEIITMRKNFIKTNLNIKTIIMKRGILIIMKEIIQ